MLPETLELRRSLQKSTFPYPIVVNSMLLMRMAFRTSTSQLFDLVCYASRFFNDLMVFINLVQAFANFDKAGILKARGYLSAADMNRNAFCLSLADCFTVPTPKVKVIRSLPS